MIPRSYAGVLATVGLALSCSAAVPRNGGPASTTEARRAPLPVPRDSAPPKAPVPPRTPSPANSNAEACKGSPPSPPAREPLRAVCAAVPESHARVEPVKDCEVCPAYTSLAGSKGGAVSLLFRGSFTGPFSEALVELVRCEPHAMWYGGTVVVREQDGGWVPVAYIPGFLPEKCELRRGPDQLDRVACREQHGENGGTYMTAATVTDLHARKQHELLGADCEAARDVEGVHWARPTGLDVDVTVLHGMRRTNDGECHTVGASGHTSTIRYIDQDGRYEPDPRSFRLLLTLASPSSSEVSPAVLAATGARQHLPKELSPTFSPLEMAELGKCGAVP